MEVPIGLGPSRKDINRDRHRHLADQWLGGSLPLNRGKPDTNHWPLRERQGNRTAR